MRNSATDFEDDGRILLVGHLPASAPGGLSWYQRCLYEELNKDVPGSAISLRVIEKGGSSARETEKTVGIGSWRWKMLHQVGMRLAARPQWHSVLEAFADLLGRGCWGNPGTKPLSAVHYIGTGRTWWGFSLLRHARKVGARFTVLPAMHPYSWGDDTIDLRLYQKADAVFCLSDFEAEHLIARGLNRDKVQRCGLPPMCRKDGNGPRLREDLRIGNRPAVLFLGRRDSGKGYFALRDAWPLVAMQIPEAVLMLAGPHGAGSLEQFGRPESLRDLGIPDEGRKADALAACDLFCLPSAHESFGIVYVEAWSYGKPVICGTAPASRELVENGETGVWANQEPQQLADRIIGLLKNGEERRRLGEAGRALQQTRYTPEAMLRYHLAGWRNPGAEGVEDEMENMREPLMACH